MLRGRTDIGQTGEEEFVDFVRTGKRVKGEFQCAQCGYGVAIHRALPLCPMCGGQIWEQVAWSPFARAGRLL